MDFLEKSAIVQAFKFNVKNVKARVRSRMNKSKKEVVNLTLKLSGERKYMNKIFIRDILVALMRAMPNIEIRILAGDNDGTK